MQKDNILKGKLILKDNTYYVTYRFYTGTYNGNNLDFTIRVNPETPKDILDYLFNKEVEFTTKGSKLYDIDGDLTADIQLTTQQRRDLILSQLV